MLIGRTIRQRYKITQYIGGGGFGDSYLAIDLDFPGQPQCVVKHLSPQNPTPETLAIAQRLFKTEAKCLYRLGEHNQIPRLYSYFEEDEQFYLVQEFIQGHNLTQEFQPGKKWTESETVKFLLELLEILTVVHQKNAIHRDLKPANIMRRDSDGKLVLIDFGAVKEVVTVDQKKQTNFTVAIGTSFYMSPEQAQGMPGKYSDVYAVGMLGIQALTGLKSEELPEDPESLQQMWQDLDIKVSSDLKSALNNMVSLQCKERYQDAVEARKALITIEETEIINQGEITNKSETTSSISKLKIKLLLLFLGTIGLASIGFYAFSNKPNYDQLEEYLKNEQWQQADAETDRLILQIAGETNSLDSEYINKLPCESLRKIDELWQENSNGRFGLTPQKKVYLDTGNQIGQYRESSYEEFGNKVKWRTFGVWSLYGDLKFTDIAPVGHLPSPGKISPDKNDLRWQERGMLLSRVDACGL